jgi:hypothetical protein
VSTIAITLQHTAFHAGPVLRVLANVVFIAAVLVFFKPLLVGIFRAAILALRPRLTREQLADKAKMRDMRMLQRMIAASSGPSHAAELRALAARA